MIQQQIEKQIDRYLIKLRIRDHMLRISISQSVGIFVILLDKATFYNQCIENSFTSRNLLSKVVSFHPTQICFISLLMETRISLDLDGNPLKRTFLNYLFLSSSSSLYGTSSSSSHYLMGYEESDEERGLMSHTCRLLLKWNEVAPSSSSSSSLS